MSSATRRSISAELRAVEPPLESEELRAGLPRIERCLLEGCADPRADRIGLGGDVVAGHGRSTAGRPEQRTERTKGRRLAGAVRAEQAIDLAAFDRQVDAGDGLVVAEMSGQPGRGNGGCGRLSVLGGSGLVHEGVSGHVAILDHIAVRTCPHYRDFPDGWAVEIVPVRDPGTLQYEMFGSVTANRSSSPRGWPHTSRPTRHGGRTPLAPDIRLGPAALARAFTVGNYCQVRAAILTEPRPAGDGPLELLEVEAPRPGADEVLIEVRACAVCRTDLQLCEGDLEAQVLADRSRSSGRRRGCWPEVDKFAMSMSATASAWPGLRRRVDGAGSAGPIGRTCVTPLGSPAGIATVDSPNG